jgi:hypothetical protein
MIRRKNTKTTLPRSICDRPWPSVYFCMKAAKFSVDVAKASTFDCSRFCHSAYERDPIVGVVFAVLVFHDGEPAGIIPVECVEPIHRQRGFGGPACRLRQQSLAELLVIASSKTDEKILPTRGARYIIAGAVVLDLGAIAGVLQRVPDIFQRDLCENFRLVASLGRVFRKRGQTSKNQWKCESYDACEACHVQPPIDPREVNSGRCCLSTKPGAGALQHCGIGVDQGRSVFVLPSGRAPPIRPEMSECSAAW